ncbi:MAG TPA: methyltetrahydrofolate cobalamin methyltransferase [Chloroflexi bacterium]|nr:methyltetrahydrofolate cobalamin methyltransferase [Chloroflexota bacterium]
MLVIGENINATNKSIAEAIGKRDEEFLVNLAKAQALAGADFIDVNAGSGHGSPQETIKSITWLVKIIQAAVEKPLAIDSDSPEVIKAALQEYRGEKLLINSVTAEPARLESIGPLVAEREAWVIALAMGTEGIPARVEERLAACERIMSYLTGLGVKAGQVLFDPLVLPIAVDTRQGLVTLKTIEQIKSHYPDARTVMGLSNISYGLPKRKLVNRAFVLMAAYAGLDAVIIDPLDNKAMSLIKVADMLAGKDPSCRAYLRAHRRGDIVD